MTESAAGPNPALSPTEQAIADAKRRIGEAVRAEDATAVIAFAKVLRSALWRREREAQSAAAARARAVRKARNRGGAW